MVYSQEKIRRQVSVRTWDNLPIEFIDGPTAYLTECPICHSPDIIKVDRNHIRCNHCFQRGRIS